MALPHRDLPAFDLTPTTLRDRANRLAHRVQTAVADLVESVGLEQATVARVVPPLGDLDNAFKHGIQYLALFQSVAPSADLRRASSEAVAQLTQTYLALFQNDRLFALVDAAHGQLPSEQDDEATRLLGRLHRMFVDNGLQLTGPARDRFAWIARRLLELRNAFMDHIATDPGSQWIAEDALQGLPESTVQSLDRDPQGRRRVRLDRPTVTAVLGQCSVAATRQAIFLAQQSLYPANAVLFEETIRLRSEAAHLLGFPSFAAQQLRHQLVGSPTAVDELLDGLATKLRAIASDEMQALQRMADLPGPLHLWDFDYYHRRMQQAEYRIDHNQIAEYFPAESTVRRMLDTFETLLGLAIVEVADKEERHVWHPEVRVFTVRDRPTSSLLGVLYTDLYPRAGKYNHAANFDIHPGFIMKDGLSPAATALVCNVSPATADLPALLQHREVITIFHELGHGIHDLLGKSQYAMFSGHRTVRDFVEAPSQLLEYWCWVPACLRQLSCHYSYLPEYADRGEGSKAKPPKEIPDALVEGLVAAKQVNQGILTLRQVAFSKFDMEIHSRTFASYSDAQPPVAEVYNSSLSNMTLLRGPAEGVDGGHGHAVTSHYMWGQEANYFSYLYTRVLAADIWATNFRADPMSATAGLGYRRRVLEKGGSVDEAAMLRELLGRAPRADAYFQELGIC
ncbi:zincin [Aspergillus ellipticus CBS 707.79]|uniref:Zincin n=1 Tax=Aspergillus ellipticus CBS 707.79 TaxID=1448320 RepID=A0A319ETM7_9EURO|nr:zincin [Aspergillus ellipticus CBS 707.79]